MNPLHYFILFACWFVIIDANSKSHKPEKAALQFVKDGDVLALEKQLHQAGRKIDINTLDRTGKTFLLRAIDVEDIDMVKLGS